MVISMVRHKGYRCKTRRLWRKDVRDRGLPGLSRFMIDYKVGDDVDILGDPSFQKRGLPFRRFHGRTGRVVGIRGRCYEVQVYDGGKLKTLFIGREHIRINHAYQLKQEALQQSE
jgi:large subunit ribosomal protein L21e